MPCPQILVRQWPKISQEECKKEEAKKRNSSSSEDPLNKWWERYFMFWAQKNWFGFSLQLLLCWTLFWFSIVSWQSGHFICKMVIPYKFTLHKKKIGAFSLEQNSIEFWSQPYAMRIRDLYTKCRIHYYIRSVPNPINFTWYAITRRKYHMWKLGMNI